ncbi:hypothetical protein EYC84_011507 [Monilinia fructicola]|uniref:Uncharacterized protein n=1 Tax=Monilinia fructicola TaxID=38448 RepID=A0A5M9J9R1_MONFR|nr:hypothetical protein EYC84_011507 [Monilinia fructicola]
MVRRDNPKSDMQSKASIQWEDERSLSSNENHNLILINKGYWLLAIGYSSPSCSPEEESALTHSTQSNPFVQSNSNNNNNNNIHRQQYPETI